MSETSSSHRARLLDAAKQLGLVLSDGEADQLLAYLALLQR